MWPFDSPPARRQGAARPSPRLGASVAVLMALCTAAVTADFAVTPIRLELDRNLKTGSVTVNNTHATQPLQAQVQLYAWSQDAEGKDRYEESNDLTWFPRLFNTPPQSSQLVRAGIRAPATTQEQTYRLFIEEIPAPRQPGEAGTAVAVAVRFGVPVFVKPLEETPAGAVAEIAADPRALRVRVANTGNVHFMIKSIAVKGGGGFAKEMDGWYLLAGAARTHTFDLEPGICSRLGQVEVKVVTDRGIELAGTASIDGASCR
jgi:fimbrial chaperone protein